MGIDETGLSGGELYTILINKEKQGKKGCLAAIIKGTSVRGVVPAIRKSVIVEKWMMILEMTMDMANNMQWITSEIAPNATKTFQRFYVERLAYETTQSVQIPDQWEETVQKSNLAHPLRLAGPIRRDGQARLPD